LRSGAWRATANSGGTLPAVESDGWVTVSLPV
jgi:hypothetical protein